MASQNICFPIITNIDISNNKYIFNNNNNIIKYGLYETSGNNLTHNYVINNIPKNYPLGFFIDSCNNTSYNDISNLINYTSLKSHNSINESIKIYVSRGNDISYNNGDYFRFYDESNNLINISRNNNLTYDDYNLTNLSDNFYFMKGVSYEFIARFDFSNSSPFELSNNSILSFTSLPTNPYKLTNIDSSFTINIPEDSDNSNNKIIYYDSLNSDISSTLQILVDNSGINYYYDSIFLKVLPDLSLNNILLSIKSYPDLNRINEISNINLFNYDNTCKFIIDGEDEKKSLLSITNSECLSQISQVELSFNILNNNPVYYFNKKTHNNDLIYIPSIKYGLYDGSYILFNIDKNYPIALKNLDNSNNIFINENYFYTKKYNKTSGIINDIREDIYKTYDFYYGAIEIIVNNDNDFIQDTSFNYLILDLSNIGSDNKYSVIEISNSLFYTTLCENIYDNFLNKNNEITFNLYNQKNNIFTEASNNNINNIYILNTFEPYKPIYSNNNFQEFIAHDSYNHDLTNLIDVSLILHTIPFIENNSDISNIQLIKNLTNNYQENNFIITYNLKYFDLSIYSRTRNVKINRGPIIEISNNENIFLNKNSLTEKIDICTNIFLNNDTSYNFYKNIEVYIKDFSGNKIYLPFNLSILGNFFGKDAKYNDNPQKIVNLNENIINFGTISSILNINNLNHYVSNNLKISRLTQQNDSSKIVLSNQEQSIPIAINNIDTDFINIIQNNSFFNNILNNNIFFIDTENNQIRIEKSNIEINDISKNIIDNKYTIYCIQIFETYNNNIFIEFTNETQDNPELFKIIFQDNDNSLNYAEISGNFLRKKFFSKNNDLSYIDISYIGNYDINIDILGLNTSDYIYNSYNNILFNIDNEDISLNKSYNIKVIDNEPPNISFLNNIESINYNYKHPYNTPFDILNIDLTNNKDLNLLTRKPVIFYRENSIYVPSISYELLSNFNNITLNTINASITGDLNAYCSIKLYLIDLCNKISDDPIILNISFLKIPTLELSGNNPQNHEARFNDYRDNGFLIDNFFVITENEISNNELYLYDRTLLNYDNNIENFEISLNNTTYFIKRSTNLNLNDLGTYDISYIVNISGETETNFIIRKVNVVKENKPYLYLYDLSNLSTFKGGIYQKAFDISRGIFEEDLSSLLFTNIYTIDSSYSELNFNNKSDFNLDFSFTYLSKFEDLSKILNAYDLCDNYFPDTSLNVKIIINLSGQEIIFKDTSNNIYLQNPINDLFFNNVSYLTSDGCFNIVTKSIININKQPQLDIYYIISDPCNNDFSFVRTINIVDIVPPTISFNILSNFIDNSFILDYDSDYNDFSYQAYNYHVNNIGFLEEISNILFDFTLEDNFSNSEHIKNNYIITISGEKIRTISDISGDILNIVIDKFKNIDNSFAIIYDFSDNQYNNSRIIRNINIINTIEPSLNVISNNNNINPYTGINYEGFINISFGNLSYNFLNDICLNHSRLNSSDISFELSYNLPDYITSISNLYESTALIYQYQEQNSLININDISFFNIATNPGIGGLKISSNILKPNIQITIEPPNFNLSRLEVLKHEAGEYLSDASLINGIYAYSIFDEFYYNSSIYNGISISYSETNIDISFNFSQNDPIHSDICYNIIYTATDKNDISNVLIRELLVQDTKGPIFEGISDNQTKYQTKYQTNEIYIDDNLNIYDIGSDLSSLTIIIKKRSSDLIGWSNITNLSDICNITFNLIENNSKNFNYNNQVIEFIDLNDVNIEYNITYIAYDKYNNDSYINKIITIESTNDIILTPIINIKENDAFKQIQLTSDFNANDYSNNDISINYNNFTKTLNYQATTNEIFENNINFTLIANYNNSSNNINILNPLTSSIISNEVNNYTIFFQAYLIDNNNFISNSVTINFNVINNIPPVLKFNNKNEEEKLILPLISHNIINKLKNNIDYFNKYYTNEIEFLNDNNEIIFSINGININDTTKNESIISLSNDSLENNIIYNMNVTYYDLSNETFLNNSDILTLSGNYIQNYNIVDNYNNDTSINRIINIKTFPPFLQLHYNSDYTFTDIYRNFYKKQYHKIFNKYNLISAQGFDYYYLDTSINIILPNISNKDILDINKEGTYNLLYRVDNSYSKLSGYIDYNVQVVKMKRFVDKTIEEIIKDYKDEIKFGIYGNNISFNIVVENSNNAIRLKKFSEVINDFSNIMILNKEYDFINNDENYNDENYNVITLESDLSFISDLNNEKFYYGNVILTINGNFNRASIKYLENNIEKELTDFILYNADFETSNIDNIFNIPIQEEYIVKTDYRIPSSSLSISNSQFNSNPKIFKIQKIPKYINNLKQLEDINSDFESNKDFYLSFGKYRFYQGHYSNFNNPIKFSYLPDGHHYNYNDFSHNINNDLGLLSLNNIIDISFNGKLDPSFNYYKYTKNVNNIGLPGFKSNFKNDISNNENNKDNYPYTEIIIDATTPSPLYYYSENFPNMGGKIEIKNNITITNNNSKSNILLNGNILAIDNSINIDYNNNQFNSANFNDNSNNRIFLSQHFDLSKNGKIEISNKAFIGLTQKNIKHNTIFNKDGKIIFKKYEDISINNSEQSEYKNIPNYNIRNNNNNNNFLYDSSVNKFKTNLLFFDYILDTCMNNFINNTNYSYLLNLNDLYFTNNQINNYYNLLKNNKLENQIFTSENFKNKINELAYINKINIKDGNNNYNYFENNILNSNKIYFEPIFDNIISLSLQSYIDIENLNLTNNYKNYLKNKILNTNKNELITNYPNQIDLSNLFLQEYIFTLYSDISGTFKEQIDSSALSLIFNQGALELNDYLLDSSYSNDIIDKLFYDISDNQINYKNILNNRIFLTIKDIDNCNNLIFNGLTQKNIYHNMYLDDEDKFIIHGYNSSSVNAFVNNNDANLLNNILELTNNKNYLLELSNNDPYNCFISSDNLYDKNIKKNNYFKEEVEINLNLINEYKTKVSYNIIPELSNNNIYINNRDNFDIRPRSLNDICYNLHPNTYDISLQNLHSHSYIVNLRNHIDRNFYNNNKIKQNIPYNIINYDKLYYVIKDISYSSNSSFNLFDLGNNQTIIYDKTLIKKLKELQSKIFVLNLSILYFIELYNINNIELDKIFINFDNNYVNNIGKQLIYDNNFENLVELFKNNNFINNNYTLDIKTKSLNDLFSYAYYNTGLLIEYNNFFNKLNNFFYIPFQIINNSYTNIINFDNITQLDNDIELINNSVKNNIITIINNKASEYFNNIPIIGISYEIFDELYQLIEDFKSMRESYEIIKYELNLRDNNRFLSTNSNINSIKDLSFIIIYDNNDIPTSYENLVNNYKTLFKFLQFDITNPTLMMNFISGYTWKNEFNVNENDRSIDLSSVYNILNLDFTHLYYDISNTFSNVGQGITLAPIVFNRHKISFNKAINYINDNLINMQDSLSMFDYNIYIKLNRPIMPYICVKPDSDFKNYLNSFNYDDPLNYYNKNLFYVGKLNRYSYYHPNFDSANKVLAFNNFSNATLVTDLLRSFTDLGDHYTHLFDGYIYTNTNKTLFFGIESDDDSYLWIVEGDVKWENLSYTNEVEYGTVDYISSLNNVTKVCSDPNNNSIRDTYKQDNIGYYTFEANTLYSILIKYSEYEGINPTLRLQISDTQLTTTSSVENSDFPDYFTSVNPTTREITNNQANINSFIDLKDNLKLILNNYISSINTRINYFTKEINNTKINYIINGDSLLVNSFLSNNILIKFDLYYNSFLYRNTYLDTFVLDMAIPDYTPPTIIFNTENLEIVLADSNQNKVDSIIEKLLQDISYIDINQEYNQSLQEDININNIEFKYLDNINNEEDISYGKNITNEQKTNSAILISINITTLTQEFVTYTIKDYANNTNSIKRNITLITDFVLPDLYYPNINNENKITTNDNIIIYFPESKNLNILENDTINDIISKAKNNVFIEDSQDNPGVFYTKDNTKFDQLLDISVNINENGEPYQIIYTLSSSIKIGSIINSRTLFRDINIIKEDETIVKPSHCCYPKVYYKPIQHNYKLGSHGSSSMRLAKFIINS